MIDPAMHSPAEEEPHPIPFVVPGIAGPIALGVSILVGIVFGVVPARKAARLNPLAALRFE